MSEDAADHIGRARRAFVAERTALPGDVIDQVLDAISDFWFARPELLRSALRLPDDDTTTDDGALGP